MNYVRDIVEANNCVFKEVERANDYGHDATVILVRDELVLPKEVAFQVKSGSSYIQQNTCKFSTSRDQMEFWRLHDLDTYGVVFDPKEQCAWWIHIDTIAHTERLSKKNSTTIKFKKQEWNRFDRDSFASIFLPLALGKTPQLSFQRALTWADCEETVAHELGIRSLLRQHSMRPATWDKLFELFYARGSECSLLVLYAIIEMVGNPEYPSAQAFPLSLRIPLLKRIKSFGLEEVGELLGFLGEADDFDRGSYGYCLLTIIPALPNHEAFLRGIEQSDKYHEQVRGYAGFLLELKYSDLARWDCWKTRWSGLRDV